MKTIKAGEKTLAIFHKASEWQPGLDFLTPNESYIQAGSWWYGQGKMLKAHVHIHNERQTPFTQEVIVVLAGKVRVDLYADDTRVFHQETLEAGDVGIILEGGHGYAILADDTRVIEVKNGPFISVEKDKRLLPV